MTSQAEKLQKTALAAVRLAFKIPDDLWQVPDSGISRVLVAAAIAMPADLMAPVKAFAAAHPDSGAEFKIKPKINKFLMGSLIAERPVIQDKDFVRLWSGSGFDCAVNTGAINPMFRKYIRFLVQLQVGYLEHHKLRLREIVHPDTERDPDTGKLGKSVKTHEYRNYELHCQHLRTLRYFLHGS
jgi:hypothetical protein